MKEGRKMSEIHKWTKKNYERAGYEPVYDDDNKAIIVEKEEEGMNMMQVTNVVENTVIFTTGTTITVNDNELANMLERIARVNDTISNGCFETDPNGAGEKYVCYRSSFCVNEYDVVSFKTFKRHVKMGFEAVKRHIKELIPEQKDASSGKNTMYG